MNAREFLDTFQRVPDMFGFAEAYAREKCRELESQQLVVRCSHCDSTLIYKRDGNELKVYHNCGNAESAAVEVKRLRQIAKLDEVT